MSKLLIVVDKRQDEKILTAYHHGMLKTVLEYAQSILGHWDSIAIEREADDVPQMIKSSDADHVLLMGRNLSNNISDISKLNLKRLTGASLYGILTDYYGKRVIATPSMYDFGMGHEASPRRASLLGHLYRHLEQLKLGNLGWENPSAPSKYRVVRNREDWLELRDLLKRARVVAIDTETRNLQRINNTLLTLQFGVDGRTGWVIPIAHPESPLDPKLVKEIRLWLCKYFESAPSAVHIYANAVFDLHQIIDFCKIRWYNHRVWDIQSGVFNLDENVEARKSIGYKKGESWSLERIALDLGMNHYAETALGKGDRSRLENKPLEEVAEYGAVDVVLPIRVMRMQRALARWRTEHIPGRPYARYDKSVMEVDGAKIQQFCFHPDTLVATERGEIKITELVRMNDPPRVWSFNHATQQKELKEIIGFSTHTPTEKMLEITHETGVLRVTESHEIWCVNRNDYVKAKDLQPDDEILIK